MERGWALWDLHFLQWNVFRCMIPFGLMRVMSQCSTSPYGTGRVTKMDDLRLDFHILHPLWWERYKKIIAKKRGWRWLAYIRWCFNKVDRWIFWVPNVLGFFWYTRSFRLHLRVICSTQREFFNTYCKSRKAMFLQQHPIIIDHPTPSGSNEGSSQFSTKSRKPLWNSMRNLCCRTSMRPPENKSPWVYWRLWVFFMCRWCTWRCFLVQLFLFSPNFAADIHGGWLNHWWLKLQVFWAVIEGWFLRCGGVIRLPILEDQRMQNYGPDWMISPKKSALFVILL